MSLQPHLKLSIPKPCHEGWDRMTVSEKGRFCNSCQKEVLDLSEKSEEGIISIITQSEGNVCGRVNARQISNDLQLKRSNSFFVQRFLAAVIIAFGSFLFSLSADAKVQLKKMKYELITVNDSLKQVKDTNIAIIKGKVTDKRTGEDVPFANVTLMRNKKVLLKTTTDLNGQYSIKIQGDSLKGMELQVIYPGYFTQLIQNVDLKKGKKLYVDVVLKEQEVMLEGEIMYVDPIQPQGTDPSGKTIKKDDYKSMPK